MSDGSMKRPDQLGALNRLGKRLAPILSTLAARPAGARLLAYLEAYLAVLQGKGSGSGWDLAGEVEVATSIIRRMQPVIVDAGANRGAWSAALYPRIAHLQPAFFLLEPSAACQPDLQSLPIPDKTILKCAVGSSEGMATLRSDSAGSEAASLHTRRDTYHQSDQPPILEEVPVITIDALMTQHNLDRIDYLKIDVEGHEYAVLEGARNALISRSIRALAFEFGSGQINSRTYFHDFWDMLHPLEYQLYRILPGGKLTPITEYYESLEYFRGVSNYVALYPKALLA